MKTPKLLLSLAITSLKVGCVPKADYRNKSKANVGGLGIQK